MKPRISISGEACILFALLCLVLPLQWLFAAFFAAAFHELCHILAVYAAGGRLLSLKLGSFGALLDGSPLPPVPALLGILAGPAGSLLLLAAGPCFPKLAFCGLVHGMFNLLPLGHLDGSRALEILCFLLFPQETGRRVLFCIRFFVGTLLLLAGVYSCFVWKLGIFPLMLLLFLSYKGICGKIPCIGAKVGVQ